MRELKDYSTCEDKELVKKAELLREKIHSVLPEGAIGYKLLGLKTKKEVYPNTVKVITARTQAEKTDVTIKSTDELTRNQIGFFQNLNNLNSLDGLKNLVPNFDVAPEPTVEGASILLMLEVRKDSMGRTVYLKNGVVFRPYTEEEEAEYQAKLDQAAAEKLGLGNGTQSMAELLAAKLKNDF